LSRTEEEDKHLLPATLTPAPPAPKEEGTLGQGTAISPCEYVQTK